MSLLSMTDCSVEANRVQARYELDRCEVDNGPVDKMAAYANWADKWGRALIDGYDETVPIDEYEAADLRNELKEAEDDAATLRAAIRDAVSDLQDAL